HQRLARRRLLLGEHAERLRRRREAAGTFEYVREGVPVGLDGKRLALARLDPDIEVARVGRDTLDRAAPAPELAADDARPRAVVIGDLGDLDRLDVLVARVRHLEPRRQVRPELEAV